jgi:hypothetical protein
MLIDLSKREMGDIVMSNAYAAVNKGLQPIKTDLATIKTQLDQINTTLEDLAKRVEGIEKLIKEEKTKVKVA